MPGLLLAVLLPGLFWDQGPKSANELKQAGIERLFVPGGQETAWQAAGIHAQVFDAAKFVKLAAPGVERRINIAAATSSPWVDSNAWRLQRNPRREYYYDVPWHHAALAAAEAYVYGADAVVHAEPRDLVSFGQMLAFLKSIDRPPMPAMANVGIVDDGSAETGEILNLLTRRNLLYRIVAAPDPRLDLNVQIGTDEFSKEEAQNPPAFAALVRRKLTDEKRSLRIFGSEVVIGTLHGDGQRVRVHLLNYGGGRTEGLRVRVLGSYRHGKLEAFGVEHATLTDYELTNGGTEFTIPEMSTYAVADLEK